MDLDKDILDKRQRDIEHQRSIEQYQGTADQKEAVRLRRQVPITAEILLRAKAETDLDSNYLEAEFPLSPDRDHPELTQKLVLSSSFSPVLRELVMLKIDIELDLTDGERTTMYPLGKTKDNSDMEQWDEYGRPKDFGLEVTNADSVKAGAPQYEPASEQDVEKMMGILRDAAKLSNIEL